MLHNLALLKTLRLIAAVLVMNASQAFAAVKPDSPHVVFFSPGFEHSNNPTGQFWPESTQFAQAVSEDLGVNLEVQHANRDYLRMQRQIAEVLRRAAPPDYLLLVNERFALSHQIRTINQAKVPFFLAYNHLQRESQELKTPRESYKYWLGALVPDNEYAGRQLTAHLVDKIAPRPASILVLAGDNLTAAAKLRETGLRNYLQNHPGAQITARINGEWGYSLPRQQVAGLLRRHPDINLIWSANGAMAIGALDAIKSMTDIPQRPAIGSINWDSEEIAQLKSGQLTVSIGGHFMTAGMSLVLVYDYHQGIDFADDGGLLQKRRLFSSMTPKQVHSYPMLSSRDWPKIDFKLLSKHHNKQLTRYNFNIKELIKASEFR